MTTLCGGIGLIFTGIALGSSNGVFGRVMQQQPDAMKVSDIVQPVISLALGIMLLIGGIGGVQVREWARKLLVKWAPIELGFQFINGVLHLYFAFTVTLPQLQTRRNMAPGFAGGFAAGQIGGIIVVVVLFCLLPICILAYWRRPEVIEAFQSSQPTY